MKPVKSIASTTKKYEEQAGNAIDIITSLREAARQQSTKAEWAMQEAERARGQRDRASVAAVVLGVVAAVTSIVAVVATL